MRKIYNLIFILILFVSCSNSTESIKSPYIHQKAKWTYAIYMAADNNLERFAIKNLNEIKTNVIFTDVNFIVILDRANGYDKTEGNWTDTKILELKNGTSLSDDIIMELGEKDTSDISTLSDFLNFVTKFYPSEYLALNIWSHGFGVYPDCKIPSENRSLIQDYTTGYSDDCAFSIIELSSLLKSFVTTQNKKLDILQFDCCLMQMIEILWQLSDVADFIIGSEAELPGTGSNYESLSYTLIQSNTVDECAYNIIEDFNQKYEKNLISATYSACDLNVFYNFKNDFIDFCNLITNNNIDFYTLNKRRSNLFQYDSNFIEYADFISFIELFNDFLEKNEDLTLSLEKLQKSFESINLNSCITNAYKENLLGYGINIPYNKNLISYYNQVSDSYLDIYRETNLSEIILNIVNAEN